MQPCSSCTSRSQRLYQQLMWCWLLRWSLPSLQFPLPVQPHVHFARSLLHQFHLPHQFCSHTHPSSTFMSPSPCWFLRLFPPAHHLVLERLHQDMLSLLTCSVLTKPEVKTRSYKDVGGEKPDFRRKWQDTKPVVFSPSFSVRRLDQRPPEILFNQNYFRIRFFLTILTNIPPFFYKISCSLDHS